MSNRIYEKIILDPRVFKPISEKVPKYVYQDGLNAIKEALEIADEFKKNHEKNNESEINLLKKIESEINNNMKQS